MAMQPTLAVELSRRLRALGRSERACGAQAYLKTSDPFFGVDAGSLRAELKPLYERFKPATQADYLAQVAVLWAIPEREGKYAAIEWALREYSKTAPERVQAFLKAHPGAFSGLSVREARKVLCRQKPA
jgi:hypothetical protein